MEHISEIACWDPGIGEGLSGLAKKNGGEAICFTLDDESCGYEPGTLAKRFNYYLGIYKQDKLRAL